MAVDFVGPRVSDHAVVVDGYLVPYLTANPTNPSRTEWEIVLDGRWGITLKHEDIETVVWFVANALAVGAGFTKHGEGSGLRNRFATKVGFIEEIPTDNGETNGSHDQNLHDE